MRRRGSRSLSFSLGMRLLESSTKIIQVSSDIVMLVEKKSPEEEVVIRCDKLL